MLDVGSKAPDFALPNQDRETVRLGDALKQGPVVLAFFPAAFSSVCTTEMCTLRDSLARMAGVGAELLTAEGLPTAVARPGVQVFGVSVDTFWTLKAFAKDQDLTFPLLSDFNKDVIRQYGVFNEDMIGLKGIAKRAVFVIDRDGTIRHREVLEDARNEPNYSKLSSILNELR